MIHTKLYGFKYSNLIKIIIIIIKSVRISLTFPLSIRPYHPSLPAGPPNYTQCPHRANVTSC